MADTAGFGVMSSHFLGHDLMKYGALFISPRLIFPINYENYLAPIFIRLVTPKPYSLKK